MSWTTGAPVVRHAYRRRIFDDLESTLAMIDRHKRGRDLLRKWTLGLACKVVDREMRKVKTSLTTKATEVTPDFIEAWLFSGFQNVVKENVPVLCELLIIQRGSLQPRGRYLDDG